MQLRSGRGLTDWEVRSLVIQTANCLHTLLQNSSGNHDGVPLDHVTASSLQVTASGHVRLGHGELTCDALRLEPDNVQGVLQSLGGVVLNAVGHNAGRPLSLHLTQLLTSLRDGAITLTEIVQKFSEIPTAGGNGGAALCRRRPEQTLSLIHEELLGMETSTELEVSSDDSQAATCLELTVNPAVKAATAPIVEGRAAAAANYENLPVLPVEGAADDSASVSHDGSFPEVPRRAITTDTTGANNNNNNRAATVTRKQCNAAECGVSSTVGSTVGATASDTQSVSVVAGNLGSLEPQFQVPVEPAGAMFPGATHRHDLLLERDMIRMMRGKCSGLNLATSTPNQSVLAAAAPSAHKAAPTSEQARGAGRVGRRASALYSRRRVGSRSECQRTFNGPEFVIRAREPARRIDLSQRSGCTGVVTVFLLNGQKLEIGCNMDSHTICDVTKAVFEEEPYLHPSLVGFAVHTGGEFLFPPPSTRLNKALASLACGRLLLHQRFKLYPSPHCLPRATAGLHLLYLQLRQNLLENSLDISSNQVLRLSSLALLAEFGDRSGLSPDESAVAYFLPEHYLPEPLTSQPELLRQLTECHMTGAAMETIGSAHSAASVTEAAERRFVRLAAECRGYGRHRCSVDAREKSYNTLMLSIDPSCLRVTRCDPCGRSTTRTLHWSTVSKIEYRRTRRLVISTVGAESLVFCGVKFKLRCLEYLLQQHLLAFRDNTVIPLIPSLPRPHQPTQPIKPPTTSANPTITVKSPQLTSYCVRSPLAALPTNSQPPRHSATPAERSPTNQRRRRSAGGPITQRAVAEKPISDSNWRSTSHLVAPRDSSPPPASIRMGTRIAVSTLQRQKLRSREVLPLQASGGVENSTPFSSQQSLHSSGPQISQSLHPSEFQSMGCLENLPPGVRSAVRNKENRIQRSPVDRQSRCMQVTISRCLYTGGLGLRVARTSLPPCGGALLVDSVTPGSSADLHAHMRPGDIITHIGDTALSALSYPAAVEKLRGASEPIGLTLRRGYSHHSANTTSSSGASGVGVKRGSAHLEPLSRASTAITPSAASVQPEKRSRLQLLASTGDLLMTRC